MLEYYLLTDLVQGRKDFSRDASPRDWAREEGVAVLPCEGFLFRNQDTSGPGWLTEED